MTAYFLHDIEEFKNNHLYLKSSELDYHIFR